MPPKSKRVKSRRDRDGKKSSPQQNGTTSSTEEEQEDDEFVSLTRRKTRKTDVIKEKTVAVEPPQNLEETQVLDITLCDTDPWVDTGEPILSGVASEVGVGTRSDGGGRKRGRNNGERQRKVVPLDLDDSQETEEADSADDFLVREPTPPTKKKRRHMSGGDCSEVGSSVSTKPKPHRRLRKETRRIRQMSRTELAIPESCSGILKSIKLYNFMCHEGFLQEWHSNLNFVTGENGSGKSALLTGLLIGLGAKATVTSRTKSMASLIKKGKDYARTEIVLFNNGALPKDKYGDEIMIERTVSRSGVSLYRLKAEREPIRKMKKHELDYILLAFNIQLENPVAILNQEVAKNFLRTKDPKDKYKLFYQGTLLSSLFELLGDSRNAIEISQKNLCAQKALIKELKKEVVQLETKLKEVENLSNVRLQSQNLGIEYLWAVANDEDKQRTKIQGQIGQHNDAIRKLVDHLDTTVKSKAELQAQLQPDQDNLAEIKAKIRDQEKTIETARKELTDAQKTMQRCRATIRTNRDTMRRKERMLSDVKKTLEGLKEKTEVDKERAIREYEENKANLIAQKAKAHEEYVSLKRDCEQFYHAVEAARSKAQNLEDEYKGFNMSYESKKRHFDALMAKGANKYGIFGRNMETLMSKIAANLSKFSKPPRGPIGAFLTVKDPNYTGLVEFILRAKSFLVTFMVNNSDDLILLKRLIQESYNGRTSYGRPSIATAWPTIKINSFSDKPYNLGEGVARIRGVRNLLDMIEVENNDPVILNGLVDYVEAEKTLLFESNDSAAKIMKDSSKITRTTKLGYTLDWFKFFPTPNYSCHAENNNNTRPTFLKSSQKEQKERLKAELQELQERISSLKPILQHHRKEEADLSRQHASMVAQQEPKRQLIRSTERGLVDNEAKKYKPPDLASHEEEIRDLEGYLEQATTENEENEARIGSEETKIVALTNQKEELQFSMNKLQKSIENGAAEKQKIQNDIQNMDRVIDRLNYKIKDLQKAKEPTVEDLQRSEKEYERKVKQAEEAGERVRTKRSALEVKREVELLRIKITAMEKHIGDSEQLKRDYRKKKEVYDFKTKEFDPILKCFAMLKGVVNSQVTFLFRKRVSITNGLTFMYQRLVSERGYKGKMVICHETKELHYYICPDQSSSNKTNVAIDDNDKATKKTLVEYTLGLSGGERSFSTICFIISLWQVMECPFYMLDEFDVFMDAFNRKASQQALIAHAQGNKAHQFFLFSPLDLVEVPAKDEATVIRLKSARPDENVDPDGSTSASQPVASTSKKGSRSNRSTAAMSQRNVSSRRS